MEMQPLQKKIETNHDTLLKMVEEANIEGILLEENVDGFNELMKYELITIFDGQVHLTEKGEKAKLEGVQAIIEQLRAEDLSPNALNPAPKNTKIYSILFLLVLLMVLAVIISLNV